MSEIKNMVLFFYTLALFVLHLYAFGYTVHAELTTGFEFKSIYWFLMFITSLQYLDILFTVFKLVKSNPTAVLVQVSGRLLVLWVATHTVGWNPVVFALVAVYMFSELCRGPYYLSQCLGTPNVHLTWLRYNAFKVLYPIGFTCEGLVFLNLFLQSGQIDVDIRNPQFVTALLFPPLFFTIAYFLYTSMSKKAAQKNNTLAKND